MAAPKGPGGPPAGWAVPSRNTHHLKALLSTTNAVLKGNCWVFSTEADWKKVKNHIDATGTHASHKLCLACITRKAVSNFNPSYDPNGDGHEHNCKTCKRQIRSSTTPRRQTTWSPPTSPPLGHQDPNHPPLNQAAFDRYIKRRYFPGAMKIVNVLLWWKAQNNPGDRLTPDDFVPNMYLRALVMPHNAKSCPPIPKGCPDRVWRENIRMAKEIAKYAFSEHHQNLRGVGYRFCTEMSHSVLEVLKSDSNCRALVFSDLRRLRDARQAFNLMLPQTRGVSFGVTTMAEVKVHDLEAWTVAVHHARRYLSHIVGFNRLATPPNMANITKEMRDNVTDAFDQTGQCFIRWGASLGRKVTII